MLHERPEKSSHCKTRSHWEVGSLFHFLPKVIFLPLSLHSFLRRAPFLPDIWQSLSLGTGCTLARSHYCLLCLELGDLLFGSKPLLLSKPFNCQKEIPLCSSLDYGTHGWSWVISKNNQKILHGKQKMMGFLQYEKIYNLARTSFKKFFNLVL